MPFSRAKRFARKLVGTRKHSKQERLDLMVPTSAAATDRQINSDNEGPIPVPTDRGKLGHDPATPNDSDRLLYGREESPPQSVLNAPGTSSNRKSIWEQAYTRLDEELRGKYLDLLEKQWEACSKYLRHMCDLFSWVAGSNISSRWDR